MRKVCDRRRVKLFARRPRSGGDFLNLAVSVCRFEHERRVVGLRRIRMRRPTNQYQLEFLTGLYSSEHIAFETTSSRPVSGDKQISSASSRRAASERIVLLWMTDDNARDVQSFCVRLKPSRTRPIWRWQNLSPAFRYCFLARRRQDPHHVALTSEFPQPTCTCPPASTTSIRLTKRWLQI